jgi:hypothetical protein
MPHHTKKVVNERLNWPAYSPPAILSPTARTARQSLQTENAATRSAAALPDLSS